MVGTFATPVANQNHELTGRAISTLFGGEGVFLGFANSPPIHLSCSSHTEVCDALRVGDGITRMRSHKLH